MVQGQRLYAMERILSWDLRDPEKIIRYINQDLPVRTFLEALALFGYDPAQKTRLVQTITAYNPDKKPDSVRRKVANWLSGGADPNSREDLAQICFALHLSEKQAQQFMMLCTDGNFHMRNMRDLTYLFCLRAGWDYPQARALYASLPPLTNIALPLNTIFTKEVAEAFRIVTTEEEFRAFIEEQRPMLGIYHNTAYRYFKHYYAMLARPSELFSISTTEEVYSIERIVDTYLRMALEHDKQTSKYTAIQKAVRMFWPNVTSVKNMLARKEDVTRKCLILLYIVTEGGLLPDSCAEDVFTLGEEDFSPEELFDNQCRAINLMLEECGMSGMDPRNPFDLIVLCSLREHEEGMAERLQALLEILFNEEQ